MYEKILDKNTFKFINLESSHYLNEIAELINSEWPRSLKQRVASIESTLPKQINEQFYFPITFILIYLPDNKIIGHASLSTMLTTDSIDQKLIFLQSLVIDSKYRGKGLGKKMMSLCEQYLVEVGPNNNDPTLNYNNLYLTTKDKQQFYESIGYIQIEPLNCYITKNENSNCNKIMNELLSKMTKTVVVVVDRSKDVLVKDDSQQQTLQPPPPPPPPLPLPQMSKNENHLTWYKKVLIK
jgi:N-acetylglutamate synthase-like GNAT family acetyltransferase